MARLIHLGIATALAVVMLSCNSYEQPTEETVADTTEFSDSSLSTAKEITSDMIDDNTEEIQELERKHSSGEISEKDYQLNKAVLEEANRQLTEKLNHL